MIWGVVVGCAHPVGGGWTGGIYVGDLGSRQELWVDLVLVYCKLGLDGDIYNSELTDLKIRKLLR